MSLKINLLIVPIALLALFSCNSGKKVKLKYIESFCCTIDSIHLNTKNIKTFSIIKFKEKPTVFYFNSSDSSINFHTIDGENGVSGKEKYFLKNVLGKSILDPFTEWLVVNEDTIFAISMKNKSVYLFNVHDQIIDSISLYSRNNKENYVCFSSSMSGMKYKNNNLVVPVNYGVEFNKATNVYFSIAGIIINLKDKRITKFGRYSNEEILNFTYYTNPYDYFDITDNNIVFSSEEDSKIYTYNLSSFETFNYPCKSNYIDSIKPFPDSCKFNHDAKTKYTIEEARYGIICYSPYDNRYYRLVKHKVEIPSGTGLYKEDIPNPKYSVIVLDSTFKKIEEFVLADKNASNFILPVKNGLIFSSSESTLRKNSNLCLDLFRNKIKYVSIAFCIGILISCNNQTIKVNSKKSLTSSQILSHFIKKKTGKTSIDGVYVFVCGPYCKGCVQQTLFSLDTLYGDLIENKNWTFFTSHDFVTKYSLKNINFNFDPEWEKVNYKFEDVVIVEFSNDSIVYSEKINNMDQIAIIKHLTE